MTIEILKAKKKRKKVYMGDIEKDERQIGYQKEESEHYEKSLKVVFEDMEN